MYIHVHVRSSGSTRNATSTRNAIGWNTEDNNAGVIKYGVVADYEPRKSTARITAPSRPALPAPPARAARGLAGGLPAHADVIMCE